MSILRFNQEALSILAQHLRGLPRGEQFRYQHFVTELDTECGSICCGLGHLPGLFPADWGYCATGGGETGYQYVPVLHGLCGLKTADKLQFHCWATQSVTHAAFYFGIPYWVAEEVFINQVHVCGSPVTEEQFAQVLDGVTPGSTVQDIQELWCTARFPYTSPGRQPDESPCKESHEVPN